MKKAFLSISKVLHDFLMHLAHRFTISRLKSTMAKASCARNNSSKIPRNRFCDCHLAPNGLTHLASSFLIAITSATHGRTAKEKVSTTAVAFTYGVRRECW